MDHPPCVVGVPFLFSAWKTLLRTHKNSTAKELDTSSVLLKAANAFLKEHDSKVLLRDLPAVRKHLSKVFRSTRRKYYRVKGYERTAVLDKWYQLTLKESFLLQHGWQENTALRQQVVQLKRQQRVAAGRAVKPSSEVSDRSKKRRRKNLDKAITRVEEEAARVGLELEGQLKVRFTDDPADKKYVRPVVTSPTSAPAEARYDP